MYWKGSIYNLLGRTSHKKSPYILVVHIIPVLQKEQSQSSFIINFYLEHGKWKGEDNGWILLCCDVCHLLKMSALDPFPWIGQNCMHVMDHFVCFYFSTNSKFALKLFEMFACSLKITMAWIFSMSVWSSSHLLLNPDVASRNLQFQIF